MFSSSYNTVDFLNNDFRKFLKGYFKISNLLIYLIFNLNRFKIHYHFKMIILLI